MLKLLANSRFLRLGLVLAVAVILLIISENKRLLEFWHSAFHEVGFALLVSFIVWAMFEVHMAQDADAEWTQRIDRVAQNVFLAVLRKDLPRALIDEARALAFDTSVLRSAFNVTYTLQDNTFNLTDEEVADCVLMVAVVASEMKNISADALDVPIGVLLPNPIHPGLKALTRVNSVSASKQGVAVPFDLVGAETRFREALNTEDQTSVRYDAGSVRLGPGETVQFRADYVMAKEPEDTELLQTIYPCDGLTVTIMDPDSSRRVMFAKAVHRRKIENQSSQSSPGTKVFRISGYLLPHQGVLIWWKRAPSGAQQQLPGVQ